MTLEIVADGLADGLEIVFTQRLVRDRFQHQDAGIAIQLDVDARAIELADPFPGSLIVVAVEVPPPKRGRRRLRSIADAHRHTGSRSLKVAPRKRAEGIEPEPP